MIRKELERYVAGQTRTTYAVGLIWTSKRWPCQCGCQCSDPGRVNLHLAEMGLMPCTLRESVILYLRVLSVSRQPDKLAGHHQTASSRLPDPYGILNLDTVKAPGTRALPADIRPCLTVE